MATPFYCELLQLAEDGCMAMRRPGSVHVYYEWYGDMQWPDQGTRVPKQSEIGEGIGDGSFTIV